MKIIFVEMLPSHPLQITDNFTSRKISSKINTIS